MENQKQQKCDAETQRGNRDDLEDTPDHLPDIEIFKVYDVVPVSLKVISVKRKNQIFLTTGLVSSRVILTSWVEGTFLALVGHPSSHVATKVPWRQMFYCINQPCPLCFWIGLVKTESDFIVRSVETDLGRLMLVVAMISVDAYPFLVFSELTCHLEDIGIGVFWLHCATWQ